MENCTGAPCSAVTAPGAPTGVVATVGITSMSVSFVAPTNNGGRAITGYTVISNPATSPVTGTSSPINVTGLTNGTVYTFTVIATNEVGNSVASSASTAVTSYNCGTNTISDQDGNTYNVVLIGTQCWTTTNLKVTQYNDGTLITDGTALNNSGFAGLGTGALSGAASYVATYGYLYNWYAVNNSRKLCPVGWHVPTDGEWTSLIQFINHPAVINPSGIQSATAGGKMKSIGTPWNNVSPSTDNYGFTALPGGARDATGAFFGVADYAFFWSATETNPSSNEAWFRILEDNNNGVTRAADPTNVKRAAFSVRCLKD